jgi:hypothetical protein
MYYQATYKDDFFEDLLIPEMPKEIEIKVKVKSWTWIILHVFKR